MRLSSLDEYLETADYVHGEETLSISFNSNAFDATFFRSASSRMRERLAELEREDKKAKRSKTTKDIEATFANLDATARAIEAERDIYAELLAKYVIRGWSATDDEDNPLPPTFENLRRLSPRALQNLLYFLRDFNRPKKPQTDSISKNQTTSEISESGLQVEATTDANLIG